jgi:hypothetical protein
MHTKRRMGLRLGIEEFLWMSSEGGLSRDGDQGDWVEVLAEEGIRKINSQCVLLDMAGVEETEVTEMTIAVDGEDIVVVNAAIEVIVVIVVTIDLEDEVASVEVLTVTVAVVAIEAASEEDEEVIVAVIEAADTEALDTAVDSTMGQEDLRAALLVISLLARPLVHHPAVIQEVVDSKAVTVVELIMFQLEEAA